MENKNYYPLRLGIESTIISDKNPSVAYNDNEFKKYGGYVMAENVPMHFAKQLIEMYNEKYGPSQRHPLIVVYGEPVSSRYPVVHASSLLDDPTDLSPEAAVKAMEKVNSLLEKDGLVIVFKKSFLRGHIGNELIKKAHVSVCIENSAHSFTEGMDLGRTNSAEELLSSDQEDFPYQERIPPRTTPSPEMQMKDALDRGELPDSVVYTRTVDPHAVEEEYKHHHVAEVFSKVKLGKEATIDQQIEWLKNPERPFNPPIASLIVENLQSIQRFNNSPALHDVDVEKVITDLLHFSHYAVKHMPQDHLVGYGFPKLHDNLMNAETALGMLQAFKKQRETPPEWVKEHAQVRTGAIVVDRGYIIRELVAQLPFYKEINEKFAVSILYAIEEMDKLKES